MEKKKKSETEKSLTKAKAAHYGMKAGSYVATVTPFLVELGVNWNDWFGADTDKPTIGMGLAMALVSTVASVVAVTKKNTEEDKKFSPMIWIGALFLMWGITFLLLSQIAKDMGWMLIYSALGIMVGAVIDQVDKLSVLPRYEIMVGIADKNGISKRGKFVKEATAQAMRDNGTRI